MPRILFVADDTEALGELARGFASESAIEIDWVHDERSALDRVARRAPDLVVVDETVGGTSGLALIRQMLGVNAFVQTAAVSRLSTEAFHEASEGLGIMQQLPGVPGREEARRLLDSLRGMRLLD